MKIQNLILLLIILFSFAINSNADARKKPVIGIEEQLGQTIPLNLRFVESSGDTVSLGSLINKPTVLSLVYYNCPNICTPLLDGIGETINKMEMDAGKEYQVLTISFDHHENAATANKWKNTYLSGLGRKIPKDSWIFMVGDSQSIRTLTDAVGFYFIPDTAGGFIHAAGIMVLTPKGKISRYLFGTTFLPFDLKMALIEASEGKSSPTINKVLKFCYSYDAKGNKYVFNFTKVAGGFLLLFVIVFLTILLVKGRKNNTGQEK